MKTIPENQPQFAANVIDVCLNACRKLKAQIRNTKEIIIDEFQRTRGAHEHLVRLALNEAEALAWQSGFPQLVFPELALEKAEAVARWQARQGQMQRHDPGMA